MNWTVETLGPIVDAEVDALPADMRARLARLSNLIERVGLRSLPLASFKHLEDRLWELRFTGRDGIARATYVTAAERRVVIVRIFVKKPRKRRLESWNSPASEQRKSNDQGQRTARKMALGPEIPGGI
jgi:phage-related protein